MHVFVYAVAGLVARLAPLWLLSASLLGSGAWVSSSMLVLGTHDNESFLECTHRYSAGISDERVICPTQNLMGLVALVPDVFRSSALIASGVMLQIATTVLIYKYTAKNYKTILWRIYWLNPVIIIGGTNSFLLCLHHFLVVLLLTGVETTWTISAMISLTLLSSWFDFTYTGAVFIVCYSLTMPINYIPKDRKLGGRLVSILYASLFIVFVGFILIYYLRYNTSLVDGWYEQVYKSLSTPKPSQQYYRPSAGVLWYLEALAFKSHQIYFHYFTLLQPMLFSLPLFVRFYGILKNEIILIVTLMMVLFLRRSNNYVDIMLLLLLPLRTANVLTRMRFLPVIFFSVVTTAIISPLMLSLWIQSGSGNANYLFFQGWVMCIFVALYITEYLNTAVRMLLTDEGKDKDV